MYIIHTYIYTYKIGIANMVRTSLGPNGTNKLVVNHLEKIIVTSDCATIMNELEVQHPAAKMLVMACEMQQSEYGDNTNFVSEHDHQQYNNVLCLFYFIFSLTIVLIISISIINDAGLMLMMMLFNITYNDDINAIYLGDSICW